jgi:hypothetical protein
MKLSTKIIALVTLSAGLTAVTNTLQAQTTNIITIAISASAQGNTSDVNGVTTAAAPSKHSLTTANILSLLAVAENAEGNYPAGSSFPTGAKLVVIDNDFQVLDAHNNFLVDVSDVISGQDGQIGNDVYSGKQNDITGLAATSETDLHILTIYYDDTSISGSTGVKFYMTGLMTSTTTDTAPNGTTGVYMETQSHKLASGTGEGIYQGYPFVLTGTLTATGKGTLVY